eukprot:NODE_3095_length_1425_cov_93.521505_g2688_i0.p1 GENE.NODE_3095_length_1425_cov_93.521505_g2688_i0~~NODE_3095_length_1425_cov_93.521505_g2688_i0.p1  ORF type:complete len:366 (+),score=88.34 NODE_3095_length_1425_cov_93.521505_g2688_i0:172-1269(+)
MELFFSVSIDRMLHLQNAKSRVLMASVEAIRNSGSSNNPSLEQSLQKEFFAKLNTTRRESKEWRELAAKEAALREWEEQLRQIQQPKRQHQDVTEVIRRKHTYIERSPENGGRNKSRSPSPRTPVLHNSSPRNSPSRSSIQIRPITNSSPPRASTNITALPPRPPIRTIAPNSPNSQRIGSPLKVTPASSPVAYQFSPIFTPSRRVPSPSSPPRTTSPGPYSQPNNSVASPLILIPRTHINESRDSSHDIRSPNRIEENEEENIIWRSRNSTQMPLPPPFPTVVPIGIVADSSSPRGTYNYPVHVQSPKNQSPIIPPQYLDESQRTPDHRMNDQWSTMVRPYSNNTIPRWASEVHTTGKKETRGR